MPTTFFDLPREIRDKIYFYLCGDQIIYLYLRGAVRNLLSSTQYGRLGSAIARGPPVEGVQRLPSPRTRYRLLMPAVTMKSLPFVCRQIRKEAMSILYSTSTLHFHDRETFLRFNHLLPFTHRSKIRAIGLNLKLLPSGSGRFDQWKPIVTRYIVPQYRGLLYLEVVLSDGGYPVRRPDPSYSRSITVRKGSPESRAPLRITFKAFTLDRLEEDLLDWGNLDEVGRDLLQDMDSLLEENALL